MGDNWDGNIETARESSSESLSSAGNDGNREYSDSKTYGQSDYTVRERGDGTSDVYVKSGSDKEHSHDRIDKDGNVVNNYHDYAASILETLSFAELQKVEATASSIYIKQSARHFMAISSNSDISLSNAFVRKRH